MPVAPSRLSKGVRPTAVMHGTPSSIGGEDVASSRIVFPRSLSPTWLRSRFN